jgi:hypothetical protein
LSLICLIGALLRQSGANRSHLPAARSSWRECEASPRPEGAVTRPLAALRAFCGGVCKASVSMRASI